MEARGLDLTEHRSRRVTEEMLRACDVALVMEDGHRQALQAEFPELANRVHLISELVGEKYSIGDPNGDPPEVYVALADELAELLRRGMPRLREMLG
jgi:protein-tyrosine-phosphatase